MNKSYYDKCSLLTKSQIYGKNRLEIFEKYGVSSANTDFAVILGSRYNESCKTIEGETAGYWWTRSTYHDSIIVIKPDGSQYESIGFDNYNNYYGVRPSIKYSLIKTRVKNEVENKYGIKEVEFGEYPQAVVEEELSDELDQIYKKELIKTGKVYTTRASGILDSNYEYEFNEKKYIRVYGIFFGRIFSNGKPVGYRNGGWVEVEPIKWLVDEKSDIALSKKILFSGVPYKNYFFNIDLKEFMNECFSKEIITDDNSHNLVLKK